MRCTFKKYSNNQKKKREGSGETRQETNELVHINLAISDYINFIRLHILNEN